MGAGQGETDVGIHLITTSISQEQRVWEVPAPVTRKLRGTSMGRRKRKVKNGWEDNTRGMKRRVYKVKIGKAAQNGYGFLKYLKENVSKIVLLLKSPI